jgi:hypothetical protein
MPESLIAEAQEAAKAYSDYLGRECPVSELIRIGLKHQIADVKARMKEPRKTGRVLDYTGTKKTA